MDTDTQTFNDDVPPPPADGTPDVDVVLYYAKAFGTSVDDIEHLLDTPSDLAINNKTRFTFYKTMAYARGYVSEIHVSL